MLQQPVFLEDGKRLMEMEKYKLDLVELREDDNENSQLEDIKSKIIANLNCIDAGRAALAEEGVGGKGNVCITS